MNFYYFDSYERQSIEADLNLIPHNNVPMTIYKDGMPMLGFKLWCKEHVPKAMRKDPDAQLEWAYTYLNKSSALKGFCFDKKWIFIRVRQEFIAPVAIHELCHAADPEDIMFEPEYDGEYKAHLKTFATIFQLNKPEWFTSYVEALRLIENNEREMNEDHQRAARSVLRYFSSFDFERARKEFEARVNVIGTKIKCEELK